MVLRGNHLWPAGEVFWLTTDKLFPSVYVVGRRVTVADSYIPFYPLEILPGHVKYGATVAPDGRRLCYLNTHKELEMVDFSRQR